MSGRTGDDGGTFTPAFIDEQLEYVLHAAGSSLRHYTPSSQDNLRRAMEQAMLIARAVSARKSGAGPDEARTPARDERGER